MKSQRTDQKKSNGANHSKTSTWIRNFIFVFVAYLLVYMCYKKNPGYNWVFDALLKSNMEVIQRCKNMTLEQRFELKLRFNYTYLNYVKTHTPDSAVILMPTRKNIVPEGQKSDLDANIGTKLWVCRFLYPRKVVYENESNNKYWDKVSYVAIINYWGYDRLPYKIANQVKNTILPIDPKIINN